MPMRDDISTGNVMLRLLALLLAVFVSSHTSIAQAQKRRQPRKPAPQEKIAPQEKPAPQEQKPESQSQEDKNLPVETTGCMQGRSIIAASFYPKGREFDINRPLTAMPDSRMLTFKCLAAPLGITGLVWFKSGLLELYLNNPNEARTLTSVDFRIFSYDKSRRIQLDKIYLSESNFCKPTYVDPEGTKYVVSGGTIHLASEQINQVVFIQLDKMKLSDGTEWKSSLDCTLSEDLTEIICQRKKP